MKRESVCTRFVFFIEERIQKGTKRSIQTRRSQKLQWSHLGVDEDLHDKDEHTLECVGDGKDITKDDWCIN